LELSWVNLVFFSTVKFTKKMTSHVKVAHKFTADGSGRDGYIHRDPKWLKGTTHTESTQYDHMSRVNEFWNGTEKRENSLRELSRLDIKTAPASLTDTQRRRERITVHKSPSTTTLQPVRNSMRALKEEGRYFNQDDIVSRNRDSRIPGYQGHIQATHESVGFSTFGEKAPSLDGTTYTSAFNTSLPLPSFQAHEVDRKQLKRLELNDSLHKHSMARMKPTVQLMNATTGAPSTYISKKHMRSPVRNTYKTSGHHISGYSGHQSASHDAYQNYSIPTRHGE
jgi:hypothetical protein